LAAWLGREALALPIWMWAIYGGITVNWRGEKFKVGMDGLVHPVEEDGSRRLVGGEAKGKRRVE